MDREANFPTSIHFGGLAVQLRQLQLGCRHWVGDWYLELEVELILQQVVHIPALALPLGSSLVSRLKREPVVISGFVGIHVCNERLELLLHPLDPHLAIAWARLHRQQRELLHRLLGATVPPVHGAGLGASCTLAGSRRAVLSPRLPPSPGLCTRAQARRRLPRGFSCSAAQHGPRTA
eukprot:scaffold5725_cov387-Prasinococcus_capsulatus_cf.AAC.6